jgi:hypothetical protein
VTKVICNNEDCPYNEAGECGSEKITVDSDSICLADGEEE